MPLPHIAVQAGQGTSTADGSITTSTSAADGGAVGPAADAYADRDLPNHFLESLPAEVSARIGGDRHITSGGQGAIRVEDITVLSNWYERYPNLFALCDPWDQLLRAWQISRSGALTLTVLPAKAWDAGEFVAHYMLGRMPDVAFLPTQFDTPAAVQTSQSVAAVNCWMLGESASDAPGLVGPSRVDDRLVWTRHEWPSGYKPTRAQRIQTMPSIEGCPSAATEANSHNPASVAAASRIDLEGISA